ncbi:adult-specific rigid cuticular protein 11.9-like [Centruroides sculpturatus]|uniref:adult-specific rigid cuticular protein 11.9-like n=1 Tax=Centruroides sculpturatus TaxID=218467 RepID=UPI000C6D532E|nr:adult-specific rigid cuticular protein 11.9-like [Centruroides sculpturatus]
MKYVPCILIFLVASCVAEQTMEIGDGKYNFAYSTGDDGGHKREESGGSDGIISGKYSYKDPNGNIRVVSYKAGAGIGFQAEGDISVDKKTAEEAEKLAALAPKPITVDLKAAPLPFPYYAGFPLPPVVPHPYAFGFAAAPAIYW